MCVFTRGVQVATARLALLMVLAQRTIVALCTSSTVNAATTTPWCLNVRMQSFDIIIHLVCIIWEVVEANLSMGLFDFYIFRDQELPKVAAWHLRLSSICVW